jgi:hypothetical protein
MLSGQELGSVAVDDMENCSGERDDNAVTINVNAGSDGLRKPSIILDVDPAASRSGHFRPPSCRAI